MDEQKSVITVLLYVAIGFGAAAVALGSYAYYRRDRAAIEQAIAAELERNSEPHDLSTESRSGRKVLGQGKVPSERIDRLQSLLNRTSQLLEMRTQELALKSREHELLRADLDAALTLLMEMMGDRPPSTIATVLAGRPDDEADVTKLRNRLESYEQELTVQTLELENLRRDLALLNADIVEDRVFGRAEMNIEPHGDREFRDAMLHSFTQIGAASVPVLTNLLLHEGADVRRFAAMTFGGMGELARDAEPALLTALDDPDPAVRAAVRDALERLEP